MNCRPGWPAFTWCKHLPGDFVRYSNRKRVQIPLGKCANGDAANRKTPAMPFPGASGGSSENATLPSGMQQLNIVPGALPDWLVSTEDLKNVTRDPLAEARRVLVVGQGGEADNQEIAMLAEAGSRSGLQSGASDERWR